MAKTRALIIGISEYTSSSLNNLPFCKNDIFAVEQAFIQGLKVDPSDIILCGTMGAVTEAELIVALRDLSDVSEEGDSLLLYFSGHGGIKANSHYLALSDKPIKTQELIECLDKINARNKLIFLDCCLAGNFATDGTAVLNLNETVDEFAGRGYAVFASCNAQQSSYKHPDQPISLFTFFLCQALTHNFIIRAGRKSLHDIHRLLFMLLEVWNKNNPEKIQTPIYRANMGGTIYFDVQDYHPYVVEKFFSEYGCYIIYSVEPVHSAIAKRYRVRIILKQPMSFSEIAIINHEIVQTVKHLNIYENMRQEERWKDKAANIVFCFFGLDETDMLNANYLCHTTWVDETQDKNWWYRLHKNCEVIDDIHFGIQPYYKNLKSFTEEHTGTREKLIAETRAIISRMVTLAEQIISLYNEYLNGTKSESDLKNNIAEITPELSELYFAEGNLDIPPNDLEEWSQLCSNLVGTIHDFTLYYGQNAFSERTPKNRKACMDISIKQYYQDLEKLKAIDTLL